MPTAEEKRLLTEVARQRKEINQLQELYEISRGFIPRYEEVHTPPPGYWADEKFRWGRIISGFLEVLGQEGSQEGAVAAANSHEKGERK